MDTGFSRLEDTNNDADDMMARRWARRIERCCCTCATYFPLAFVYGLTTWAVFVIVSIGSSGVKTPWIGSFSSTIGIVLYAMVNWSYTVAVFTPPGSTTNDHGYSTLPTQAPPKASSLTVKSNGELRFCKKCQARKPDRAHHCSTCRRCVLKMDHHCPWLATCVGLRNHKPFILFLIYTSIFSLYAFAVSGTWVWEELSSNATYVDSLMPVNYIILCVIGGIIGVVVSAFTGWHIHLACRGQTTIECLEKTRYLSPLRKGLQHAHSIAMPRYGHQLIDAHAHAIPGVTSAEEGEEMRRESPPQGWANGQQPRHLSYEELERYRAKKRYEEYLDEQDSEKLPHAFDLGARRNLQHLFGTSPWLWALPVCNSTGDGWSWEPSPKWVESRDRLSRERREQQQRERAAGWGLVDDSPAASPTPWQTTHPDSAAAGAGRHYTQQQLQQQQLQQQHPMPRKAPSKADRILGRDPNLYADVALQRGVPMRRLSPKGRDIEDELLISEDEFNDEDEDDLSSTNDENRPILHQSQPNGELAATEAERPALNLVANGGWVRSASGLLRKSPPRTASQENISGEDDGVD